ncbi:hypothetical protein MBLNU230_g8601t1 [Neophaeotheca triangularis]
MPASIPTPTSATISLAHLIKKQGAGLQLSNNERQVVELDGRKATDTTKAPSTTLLQSNAKAILESAAAQVKTAKSFAARGRVKQCLDSEKALHDELHKCGFAMRRAVVKGFITETKELQRSIAEMTAGIEQMKEKHAKKLNEEHSKTEELAASAETKRKESAIETEKLNRTIEGLTAEIERTKQKYKDELHSKQKEMAASAETEREESAKEMEKLNRIIEDLTGKIERGKQRHAEKLEEEHSKQKEMVASTEVQKGKTDTLENEVGNLKQTIDDLTARIKQTKDGHAESLREHEENKEKEMAALEENKKKEMAALEENKEKEMAALEDSKKKEKAAFENDVKRLKQTIKELTAGIGRIKNEHAENLREHEETKKDCETLRREATKSLVKDTKDAAFAFCADEEKQRKALEAKDHRIQTLQQQVNGIPALQQQVNAIPALQKQVDAIPTDVAAAEERGAGKVRQESKQNLAKIKQQLETAKNTVARLTTKRQKLQAEVAGLETERENFPARISAAEKDKKLAESNERRTRGLLDDLREETTELLRKRRLELEERHEEVKRRRYI